jgi:hypothetical protein
MTCPRCQGRMLETLEQGDEGWVTAEFCLNCGHRRYGAVVMRYGAVRKCQPKGCQEIDEFVLRRSGAVALKKT